MANKIIVWLGRAAQKLADIADTVSPQNSAGAAPPTQQAASSAHAETAHFAQREPELESQWNFLDSFRDSHCPPLPPLGADEAMQVSSAFRFLLHNDPLKLLAEHILHNPNSYVDNLEPALTCMHGNAANPLQWITGATRRRVAAWCLGRAKLTENQHQHAVHALCSRVVMLPARRLIWTPFPGVTIALPNVAKARRGRIGAPEKVWVFGALAHLADAAAVPLLLQAVWRERYLPRDRRRVTEHALVRSLYSLTAAHTSAFPGVTMGTLVQSLFSRNPDVSEAVLWSLGVVGDSRSLKVLKRARALPTREELLAAVLAMVEFRDRQAREFRTLLRPAQGVDPAERLLRPATSGAGLDNHLLVTPYSASVCGVDSATEADQQLNHGTAGQNPQ